MGSVESNGSMRPGVGNRPGGTRHGDERPFGTEGSAWLGRFDWPVVAAEGLTCIAEAALLWLYAAAAVALTTDGGRLPAWLPLALLVVATAMPRVAYAVETSWLRGETIVGFSVVASLVLALAILSAPEGASRTTGWVRPVVDSLVLRPNDAAVPAWLVVILVAAAWWRGRFRPEPSLEGCYQLLRVGVPLAFLGAAVLASMDRGPGEASVARAALVFLLAALTAIAHARLTGVGGERRRFDPIDAAIAFLPIGAILVAGLAVVALVSGDALGTLGWALEPVIWAVTILLEVMILIIVVAAYLIVAPIFWLVGRSNPSFHPIRIATSPTLTGRDNGDAAQRAHTIPDPIRYVITLAVLAAIFAGVNQVVQRRRRNRVTVVEEIERETTRPAFSFGDLLGSLLGVLRPREQEDPLAGLRGDARWAATVRIRERYAEFLAWCAARDLHRRADASPDEHRREVARRLATQEAAAADVTIITERYERARYAAVPATPADADAVDAAWRRIERRAR